MDQIAPATRQNQLAALLLALTTLLISACGLGMDAQARIERGQEALEQGEYRAAIIDAKNVLLEDPGNVAARLLLGRASVEIRDGVSGEKELRRAIDLGIPLSDVAVALGRAMLLQARFDEFITEITPALIAEHADRLMLMRLRGHAMLGLQQPVIARELFTEVLAADRDDIEAQLGVVQSYFAEQNFSQARETLNQVLTFSDKHVNAWLASGSLSMRMRNTKRAASDFAIAIDLAKNESDPSSEMQALSGYAEAVLAEERVEDARPTLTRMLQIAPQDSRTLLISARLAAHDKDWTKAQVDLQEILRRAPNYRPAQILLGVVHKESGNLAQAEMYLSAVVNELPGNANARRLLAETRLQMNKAVEAREALEPIVAAADADVATLSMAAGASISLGEFDDATELLRRALTSSPQNIDLQIQLAFAYFRSGDADRAQQILEAIPADAAGSSDFRRDSLLVLTRMAQGSTDEALEEARALRTRWSDRVEAHILVGSIEMSSGDFAAAQESFDAAIKIAPDDLRPIRSLAQLDLANDDLGSAAERYLLILELQPRDAFSMVALARIAAHSEKPDEAREWLERARNTDSTAVTPRRILGSLYIASGEFSAAADVAKEAIELDPTNAVLQNIRGLALLSQEDYRGAALSFEKATRIDPGDPAFRLNLARAQAKQGNNDSALSTLQDSQDHSLQHIPSAIMMASLKAQSGDFDGAKAIARQLRNFHPDDAAPYVLEAELFARTGNLMEASAVYDRALAIENTQRYAVRAYQIRRQAGVADQVMPLVAFLQERPMDSNMRVYLALAYQAMNEVGNANSEYERVLKNEPDNYIAANNLAWSYFTIGDARAEEVARRAYDMKPDDSSVVDTLGWILLKKGAVEEGIAMLRKAVKLGNDKAEIRYHLAAALAQTGDEAEARGLLADILSGDQVFSSRVDAERLLALL